MNIRFKDFVDTLTHIKVLEITISPEGEFNIPSEKDGRIALISPTTRQALAAYMREKADELECPDPAHVKKVRTGMRRRSDRRAA